VGPLSDGPKRLVLCVVVAVVVAGGIVAGRSGLKSASAAQTTASLPAAGPSAIPADDVLSADWYCAAAAPQTLVVSNFSSETVNATVGWTGTTETKTLSVRSDAVVEVHPPQKAKGPTGATVQLDGGQVAVSEFVGGATGWSVTNCASTVSPTWYFPVGSTIIGNSVTLDLYNPSVTPAVVDVGTLTRSGEAQPSAYQGLSVPPGGIVSERLDTHATNDPEVATIVTAASGAIVADELTYVNSGGTKGFTDLLGTTQTSTRWAFPYCVEPRGGALAFELMNPSATASQVVIDATYGKGIAVHPVTLSVAAQSTATVSMSKEPGFVPGTPYSVVLNASVPVVAGRFVHGRQAHKRPGAESAAGSLGVPLGSNNWIVPSVPTPVHALGLAVEALGKMPVRMTFTRAVGGAALVAGAGATTTVEPGESVSLNPKIFRSYSGPIRITADGPTAVELDASPAAGAGLLVVPAFAVG
jgi:Family of unknown function (DUF5719)